jgi:uncharacterized membrane protein
MAFCKQCGAQVPDGANNCPACGAPVEAGANTNSNAGSQFQQAAAAATNLGADHTSEYDPADIQANKTVCGFAYLGILFFLPLVACPKESRVAKFHANQGLLLFIVCVALGVVSGIFSTLGWWVAGIFLVLSYIISSVGGLATLALMIIGMVNTFNGRVCELPVIGKITLIK